MVYVYVYTCTSAYGNGSYLFTMILSAIGSQKVSCLCLLHLFAAFDTIALNIIITRLSRLSSLFGIHGSSRHTYHLAPCVLTATRLFILPLQLWCSQGSVVCCSSCTLSLSVLSSSFSLTTRKGTGSEHL